MKKDSTTHSHSGSTAVGRLENVLVYSKPSWYVHPTLSATNHWLLHFGWDVGVNIDQTDDAGVFNLDDLMRYQVLVLNSTTNFGQDLTDQQKADLVTWFRQGHGIVSVHAAAVHHGAWNWYANLVGCDLHGGFGARTRPALMIDPANSNHPAVTLSRGNLAQGRMALLRSAGDGSTRREGAAATR